jgi:hypothetical protein
LIGNLENEIIGYRKTLKLIKDLDNWQNYLPEKSRIFFDLYQESFSL